MDNLTAECHLYDLKGNRLSNKKFQVSVASNTTLIAGKPDLSKKPAGFYFMRMLLKDGDGKTIDENLYWLTRQPDDFRELDSLKPADLQLKMEEDESGKRFLQIQNAGSETAFFTRLKVVDKTTGQLVLPVFLEDNYLTFFPGEEKRVGVDLSHLPSSVKPANLVLQAEAWNSEIRQISLN